MAALPPSGCSFSLFALSEFFTIHFSSFAWARFNSGFHPFTASQIANPHSPLVFQRLLKKLPPSFSSWPPPFPLSSPRLAPVPWLSLPASFLFLLFPLSLFISLSLLLPPPLQAGSFALARVPVAGLAPRQQGAGPGRGRGGAGARAPRLRELLGVRADSHKAAAAEKAWRPARSALGRGLRQTLCASDDRELQPPFISEVLCSALLAGPPSPLLRRLLPSSFPRALSLASAFPASLRHRGRHG